MHVIQSNSVRLIIATPSSTPLVLHGLEEIFVIAHNLKSIVPVENEAKLKKTATNFHDLSHSFFGNLITLEGEMFQSIADLILKRYMANRQFPSKKEVRSRALKQLRHVQKSQGVKKNLYTISVFDKAREYYMDLIKIAENQWGTFPNNTYDLRNMTVLETPKEWLI
jgi:hypothetical protein